MMKWGENLIRLRQDHFFNKREKYLSQIHVIYFKEYIV